MNEIAIGTVRTIINLDNVTVLVQEYKFNSLRRDSYWVTKQIRKCKNREAAEKFAARWN